jgi:hypothetical protein
MIDDGGATLDTAAAAHNVYRGTLHAWLKRGAREPSGPYREFRDSVVQATARVECQMAAVVTGAAAAGSVQAAQWWLERRSPRHWGLKVALSVQQELGAFLDRVQAKLPSEVYAQVLDAVVDDAPVAGELPASVALVDSGR